MKKQETEHIKFADILKLKPNQKLKNQSLQSDLPNFDNNKVIEESLSEGRAKTDRLIEEQSLVDLNQNDHYQDQTDQPRDQPLSLPKVGSLPISETLAYQNNSLPNSDSLPVSNSLPISGSLLSMSSLLQSGRLPVNGSLTPITLWDGLEEVKGFTKIPNLYLDKLTRLLDPTEQAIYLQLFRLSWGYGKEVCNIGLPKLAERANVGKTTAQSAIKRLIDKKLVEKIDWSIGKGKDQGTIYKLPLPSSLSETNRLPESGSLPKNNRLPDSNTIKDHDHDLKITNHHQSETMMIYKNLTGNKSWTKSDIAAYEKIKHLSLEEITVLIKSTLEKAHQKPASLAYFVKAYQNPSQANPANRQAIKAKIAAIVERKREAHVGTRYTISGLSYDVKTECIREGIVFDNEIFNEVLENKKG